jgi:hypothetical protein
MRYKVLDFRELGIGKKVRNPSLDAKIDINGKMV